MYKVRSLALSVAVGKEAAKRGVKAFVELSTGMVYKPDSQPSKEGDKLKPWSKIAVFKLQAEEQLAKIDGYVFSISTQFLQFLQLLEILSEKEVDRPLSSHLYDEQADQHIG